MHIDLSGNPAPTVHSTSLIYAHHEHLELSKVACYAITTSKQFKELPFELLVCTDNYADEETESVEPEDISLDCVNRLQHLILLFYKFTVDVAYNKNINQVVIAHDTEYSKVAYSLMAGYYILIGEDPDEAVAMVAINNPMVFFDYPTICFLDLALECNQKLIEAVETYEVMEIAVTKKGLVVERSI